MNTCLVVAVVLAVVAAFVLFQAKQRSQALDAQIAGTLVQVATTKLHAEVLQAEWAQLDTEERLRPLAKDTRLRPLVPGQYTALRDLPARLPPRPWPDLASLRSAAAPGSSRSCLGRNPRRCATPDVDYSQLLGSGYRLAP